MITCDVEGRRVVRLTKEDLDELRRRIEALDEDFEDDEEYVLEDD